MQSLSLRAGCRAYKGNSGRQETNDAEVIKKTLKLWHVWLATKFEAYNVLYK